MGVLEIIVIVLCGAIVISAVIGAVVRKKKGKTCCGDCSSCGSCPHCKGKTKLKKQ